jgi:hypothetical protein
VQWAFTLQINNLYTVVSSVNQMSNIGFGDESTQTPNVDYKRANMERFDVTYPLKIHSKSDELFDFVSFYRFSYLNKKSFILRICLKVLDVVYRK